MAGCARCSNLELDLAGASERRLFVEEDFATFVVLVEFAIGVPPLPTPPPHIQIEVGP